MRYERICRACGEITSLAQLGDDVNHGAWTAVNVATGVPHSQTCSPLPPAWKRKAKMQESRLPFGGVTIIEQDNDGVGVMPP